MEQWPQILPGRLGHPQGTAVAVSIAVDDARKEVSVLAFPERLKRTPIEQVHDLGVMPVTAVLVADLVGRRIRDVALPAETVGHHPVRRGAVDVEGVGHETVHDRLIELLLQPEVQRHDVGEIDQGLRLAREHRHVERMAVLVERHLIIGTRTVDEVHRAGHLRVVERRVGHRIADGIGPAPDEHVGDQVEVVLVGDQLAPHDGVDRLQGHVPIQHGLHQVVLARHDGVLGNGPHHVVRLEHRPRAGLGEFSTEIHRGHEGLEAEEGRLHRIRHADVHDARIRAVRHEDGDGPAERVEDLDDRGINGELFGDAVQALVQRLVGQVPLVHPHPDMEIPADEAFRNLDGGHRPRREVGAGRTQGVVGPVIVDVEIGIDAFAVGEIRPDRHGVRDRRIGRRVHLAGEIDVGVEHPALYILGGGLEDLSGEDVVTQTLLQGHHGTLQLHTGRGIRVLAETARRRRRREQRADLRIVIRHHLERLCHDGLVHRQGVRIDVDRVLDLRQPGL